MADGKRPSERATPWTRWAAVIAGLAIAGAIVWWAAGPDGGEAPDGAVETPADGPRPLDTAGGGPTVEEAARLDVPADSLVSAGPDAPTGVDVSNDPRTGAADAPVTVVEFSDFQCPWCGRFHRETLPALERLYGERVRWVFVNAPAPGHRWAEIAAIAGECAARQGRFDAFADHVFGNQEDLDDDFLRRDVPAAIGLEAEPYLACLNGRETASEVAADAAEAGRVGVRGTPTFFVNGSRIEGAQPVEVWAEAIGPHLSP